MLEKISEEQSVDTNVEIIDNLESADGGLTVNDSIDTEESDVTDISPEIIEVIEDVGLDNAQKGKLIKAITSEVHRGPIPHPRILKGYEEIIPGAADRILSMAESEAQHRHEIDNKCVKADSRDSLLGIISAFILGLSCIVGGILVIIMVPKTIGIVSGTVITGSGLAGILGTFISGTKATWKK